MGGRVWSAEEIERVKALYPVKGWPVLLHEFPGRSKASIRCQVISLGIKRQKNSRTPWLGSENIALRRLYASTPWPAICAAIPRHPQSAIAKQANSLGLKRDGAKCKSRYRIIRELREIRRASKEPRANVAARIGIHIVQLAKWETGAQRPRLDGFFKWVDAMGRRLELAPARTS